jgi:hypothetical protein
MFSRTWLLDTTERVLASFAGTLLSVWGVGSGLNLLDVNWQLSLSLAGGAALVSLLKAVGASRIGDQNSASLAKAVRAVPAGRHELR